MINATCYETGKNWRFERSRMGDYVFGYSTDTHLPLSDALAASAGFPGLIGPLVMNTGHRSWFQYRRRVEPSDAQTSFAKGHWHAEPAQPAYRRLHLWDGGVYDNLGLEALHNFSQGWRDDVDFLIASDGCCQEPQQRYRPWNAPLRLIQGIMMDQIRSLRYRALLERFVNHGDPGVYLQIGRTCEQVLREAGRTEELDQLCEQSLPEDQVRCAAEMGTHVRRLPPAGFARLFRHGFEVADYTLYAYHGDAFGHVGYEQSQVGALVLFRGC
jgi:NTE family protein